MEQSILISTKKILGFEADYTAFDLDILTHINTVFATLSQLGIGPSTGFVIEDASAQWSDFLGVDLNLSPVKTYVYLRVRNLFDPPASPVLMASMEKQIQEFEFRLNAHREQTEWVNPNSPSLPQQNVFGDPVIIDGGVG